MATLTRLKEIKRRKKMATGGPWDRYWELSDFKDGADPFGSINILREEDYNFLIESREDIPKAN